MFAVSLLNKIILTLMVIDVLVYIMLRSWRDPNCPMSWSDRVIAD